MNRETKSVEETTTRESNYLNMDVTPGEQMVSSVTGALLVSLFMTPLDVVKIRLQTQDLVREKKCFLYSNGIMDYLCERSNGGYPVNPKVLHSKVELCNCNWYNRPKYFNGTYDAFVKISRTEGVKSLWSGLGPTLISAIPTTVIYFTTYEQLRDSMLKHSARLGVRDDVVPMVAGAAARVWAVTIVSPLELVRTKMQSKKMSLSEIRSVLGQTLRNQGPLGLMRGYSATLYRDVPFSAIYWSSYEFFKKRMVSSRHEVDASFVAGGIGGAIASTLTLPMDVIKTRRQITAGEDGGAFANGNGNKKSFPSTYSTAKEIVSGSGIRGLFAGLTPRVLKVAPACAIMISSYEYCKRFFASRKAMDGKYS